VSQTPSATPSSSPSPGWEQYSKEQASSLPTDDSNLSEYYSGSDYTDVATDNSVRVSIAANANYYAIHQFKDFAGSATNVTFVANLQSELAPLSSTVYMQIYNYTDNAWETIAGNNSAASDTDFTMVGDVQDLTNYVSSELMTCRIYQENTDTTSNNLRIDLWSLTLDATISASLPSPMTLEIDYWKVLFEEPIPNVCPILQRRDIHSKIFGGVIING